jgi:hypothetical protein
MRVQRVASPDTDEQSWTVLGDDWRPVAPVEQFLSHLSDQRRSPNTVKAYAHDGRIYAALTNNDNRGIKFPADEANPVVKSHTRDTLDGPLIEKAGNRNGYVLELTEEGR